MAPQTHDAPYLDSVLTYGHDVGIPQIHNAPFLDSLVTFAPSVIRGTPSGLEVYKGSTLLTGALSRSWLDEYQGPGQIRLSLPNDDPDMPDFDDLLTFKLDGITQFGGVVQSKRAVMGEGDQALTECSGMGRIGITDGSVIPPSRGWDAVPVEVTRSQSWVAADFDDSGWVHAKRIRRADTPRPYSPFRAGPEWWPDSGAYWVAPNWASVTGYDAPVGQSLYRSDPITIADDGTIAILTGFNNLGTAYWNGAPITDVQNAPSDGNRIDLEVTASSGNILSASVINYIRDTGFIASIWTVDDDGLLDTLLWSSDSSNMLAVGYPDNLPGPTAGKAIRQMLEAIQAEGELLDLTLDFGDHLDSAGHHWDRNTEIVVDVGRSFMEYVMSLADWLIDVQMAPGGNILRAWNWGTRGGTPGVSITQTTDAATSETDALTFDGKQTRANRLRIRYKRGYTVVDLSGSDPTVTRFLDLRDIETAATARKIGTKLLQLRKQPSWAGRIRLAAGSAKPYRLFGNGDTVTHPPDPDGSDESVVRSIAVSQQDDSAAVLYDLELHDVRLETVSRQENWLKRLGMGAFAGGARVTSRRGDSIPPASKVASKDVGEFSFQEPEDGALTAKRPATSSGNLIDVHVEVSTLDDAATASDTTVEVYRNGGLIATVTIPAGETSGSYDLAAEKVYRNIDVFRAKTTAVGVDVNGKAVNGVDVQIRAI